MNVESESHDSRPIGPNNGRWMTWFQKMIDSTERDSTEARLAHENLLAINADLRKQVEELQSSSSFRLGNSIVRFLGVLKAPAHWFKRHPIRRVVIHSVWPRLQGEVLLRRPTTGTVSVSVHLRGREILAGAVDLSQPKFDFCFPLGLEAFSSSELSIDVSSSTARNIETLIQDERADKPCTPLEVAVDSVISIEGDAESLRQQLATSSGVALLAMFRDRYRTDDLSSTLIRELKASGFLVVVVDTSPEPPPHTVDCDLYIHRRNIGWDFASWAAALFAFPWLHEECRTLLLTNDSNIGPLTPLSKVFEKARANQFDAWGITDSWEIGYHLQSYFLCFEQSALRSGLLIDFFGSYGFPVPKQQIIETGEIGLSSAMLRHGLKVGAVFPYDEVCDDYLRSRPESTNAADGDSFLFGSDSSTRFRGLGGSFFDLAVTESIQWARPLNPTHYFWESLVRLGSPFIKRELLLRNPAGIPGLQRVTSLMENPEARRIIEEEASHWEHSSPFFSLPLAIRMATRRADGNHPK